MAAVYIHTGVASEQVRLMVLAFGVEHAFRVLCIEEITREIPNVRKEDVRGYLDQLAQEGLVTRFSGRYCFNRIIPEDVLRAIEEHVTRSGTIRARR